MSLTNRLLSDFEQIVIYGAKGWFGRSAIDLLMQENPNLEPHQLLFVGSKSESALDAELPFDVYSSADALVYTKSNILFLNSAYLRREKLISMSEIEYQARNHQIMEFGKGLLKDRKIKTFINLSSGVASQGNLENLGKVTDSYTKCKIADEVILTALCEIVNTALINCRIYSMSGKFINEFEHLALSSFIRQAKSVSKEIIVDSPLTARTYVDSLDLARVLFELSIKGETLFLDSGGTLTTLGDLATKIAGRLPGVHVNARLDYDMSPNYYGDYQRFNEIVLECKVNLLELDEQITETMKAF